MEDARGSLSRLFDDQAFAEIGLRQAIRQINHSVTHRRGTVRGLHFQHPPHAETRIVSCLRGEIFDVAVDLRPDSPSFLKWHGEVLSAENLGALCIPEGFAHGFQALSDECELLYLHTGHYTPEAEGALHATDPRLGIVWPLAITAMSERDRAHPFIAGDFPGIRV